MPLKDIPQGSDRCRKCNHGRFRHRVEKAEGERVCSVILCKCDDFEEPPTEAERRAEQHNLEKYVLNLRDWVSKIPGENMTDGLHEKCDFCGHKRLAHFDTENPVGAGSCNFGAGLDGGCQCPQFIYGEARTPLAIKNDEDAVPFYDGPENLSKEALSTMEKYLNGKDEVTELPEAVLLHKQPIEDPVNHPSHYSGGRGPEVIETTRWYSFNRGNAIKYIARAGKKDPSKEIEDLEKAIWYLKDELKILRGEV